MIGQEELKHLFTEYIEADNLPRFFILTGPQGQGKKTFVKWLISNLKNYQSYTLPDIAVDTVRDMISTAYKQKTLTLIFVPNADGMSIGAKNALLKVTEEVPNQAHIVMTLEDINNTLATIHSRAMIYSLSPYTQQELLTYIKENVPNCTNEDKKLLLKLAINPGQINTLVSYNVQEFYSYVEKVFNHIATVSGANAFKIVNKVALKEEAEGYDPKLFLTVFNDICFTKITDTEDEDTMSYYKSAIDVTEEALNQLRIKGLNQSYIMDKWILNVRQLWM